MALVKFVEDDGGNVPQPRVGDHLPQENALGDEEDAGLRGGNIVQPDAIADLRAERDAAFLGHALGQHAGGQPAGLQDDAAALAQRTAVEEDLRHLGGFSRAGRGLKDETAGLLGGHDLLVEIVNGKMCVHAARW